MLLLLLRSPPATGGSPAPVQRGVGGVSSSWPIAAPAGLAENDVVYIAIVTEDPDNPAWTMSGFTSIFSAQAGGSAPMFFTILRGVIGSTPPASFTATTPAVLDYFRASITAWSGASGTEVVGVPYSSASNPSTALVVPGITVASATSTVLAFSVIQFREATVAGWTLVSGGADSTKIGSIALGAGATGDVTATATDTGRPTVVVLVAVSPVVELLRLDRIVTFQSVQRAAVR